MNDEFLDVPQNYPRIPINSQGEQDITNIVAQIDPKTIIDNLNHALNGEYFDKEQGIWVKNVSGKPLVNDDCRGFLISYLDGILTNNTTMANLDENKLSFLMESVIETIGKNFTCRLEEFGFVPPGPTYNKGIYENKGTPDTAKMTMASNMIYKVCFLVFTRALKGQESIRIFKSLSMVDTMSQGMGGGGPQQKKGWLRKLVGV